MENTWKRSSFLPRPLRALAKVWSLPILLKTEIGDIKGKNQLAGRWMNVGPRENFTLKNSLVYNL
jgi:hypothetical protein